MVSFVLAAVLLGHLPESNRALYIVHGMGYWYTDSMKSNRAMSQVLLAIAFAVVLSAGCSRNPSEGDARKAVQDEINTRAKSRIRLTSFYKSDGQEREGFGVKFYRLDYQAEVEFTEDCGWVTTVYRTEPTFETVDPIPKNLSELDKVWYASGRRIEVKKGQREKLSGSVEFEKTENGWRCSGLPPPKLVSVPPSSSSTPPPVAPVGVPGSSPLTPQERAAIEAQENERSQLLKRK